MLEEERKIQGGTNSDNPVATAAAIAAAAASAATGPFLQVKSHRGKSCAFTCLIFIYTYELN